MTVTATCESVLTHVTVTVEIWRDGVLWKNQRQGNYLLSALPNLNNRMVNIIIHARTSNPAGIAKANAIFSIDGMKVTVQRK